MKVKRIGIAGEDGTDCDTLKAILRRMVPEEMGIRVKSPATGGCAALRRKARAFFKEFADKGCQAAILIHDLDRNPNNGELNDFEELSRRLERIEIPESLIRYICIPIEEIEAWFWADQRIVDRIGLAKAGKAELRPEAIRRPKEKLMSLSTQVRRRPVYSTNMNSELARELDLDICAERCPSFQKLCEFVNAIV